MSARPSTGNPVYRAYKHPAYPGQRRVKMWQFLIPPVGPNDPTWQSRARVYWGQQMDLYGVTFTAFWLEIDFERNVVKTFAVVGEVLPGKRETHRAEEVKGAMVLQ